MDKLSKLDSRFKEPGLKRQTSFDRLGACKVHNVDGFNRLPNPSGDLNFAELMRQNLADKLRTAEEMYAGPISNRKYYKPPLEHKEFYRVATMQYRDALSWMEQFVKNPRRDEKWTRLLDNFTNGQMTDVQKRLLSAAQDVHNDGYDPHVSRPRPVTQKNFVSKLFSSRGWDPGKISADTLNEADLPVLRTYTSTDDVRSPLLGAHRNTEHSHDIGLVPHDINPVLELRPDLSGDEKKSLRTYLETLKECPADIMYLYERRFSRNVEKFIEKYGEDDIEAVVKEAVRQTPQDVQKLLKTARELLRPDGQEVLSDKQLKAINEWMMHMNQMKASSDSIKEKKPWLAAHPTESDALSKTMLALLVLYNYSAKHLIG